MTIYTSGRLLVNKCKRSEGHLFETQKVPLRASQYFCGACGEIQEYDPITKAWKVIKEGEK
jgi:hypothetical protein